jgi:hypothetical protein
MSELTETQIQAIVHREINNSLGYLSGQLTEQRKKSLEYYLGEKLGTEIDGRSQVVSTDVADTIETILPNLLRIFTASDRTVICEPVKAEDVPLAEQATNYINYIFNKDNPGFNILYSWFKDALLEKNGIVKVYWDESQKTTQETYKHLEQDEYDALLQDDNIEIIKHEEIEDDTHDDKIAAIESMAMQQGQDLNIPRPKLHNVILKRTSEYGKVKIENVPPEEFLIQRNAKTIEESNFVAHRTTKTRTELLQMGYDPEIIAQSPHSQEIIYNTEKMTRFSDIDEYPFTQSPDSSTDIIDVFECYVRLDYNGDGFAELRKIVVVGDTAIKILENVAVDSIPFCSLTPIPMPHRFYGRSVSELVQDIQLVKSTVLRQLLDNMYLTNNNRIAIMDGMVNLDDLLTARPGGVVRTKQPPSQVMLPMQNQTISAQAFPLLEYLDTVRETRTGVTRYSQGLEADSLNKTATGINTLMTQTQMRMELIARIFAETGVKDLFRKIFELTVKYQDKGRMIELNNAFVMVKPTEWKDRYNINIVVGLGSGSKEQQLIILNSILEKQLQAFSLQGNKEYPMVTLKNIYNTLSKMIENAGLKNTENYFVNPEMGMKYIQPPQPAPLSPIEKIEFTRIDSENKRKQADLELQFKQLQLDTNKMQLDFQTKMKELELKYHTQIDVAKLEGEVSLTKARLDNASKNLTAAQQATQQFGQQVQELNATRGSDQTPIGG